jgi:putative nucleotidyltransferase with HDIG domain
VKQLDMAVNGREGLDAFNLNHYDVVVTDIKMPVMDGLEMAEQIKKTAKKDIPIIVITAYSDRDYLIRAIDLGINRYVTKPIDADVLLGAIYQSARARFNQLELVRVQELILETLQQTITVLSRAIEMRDPYTDGHQKRVALLATAIAEEMGLPADRVTGIRVGGLIHDIGKIHIPTEILSKPGKLTPLELDIIKTHSEAGFDILKQTRFPWPIDQMILQHHEKLDGSGYPTGLKGEEILLEARIITVADVIEAMSSHRPYRPALGIEAALEEIRRHRGVLYDEKVVDSCLRVMDKHGNRFFDN